MKERPPEEIERARAVLVRAVAQTCPNHLADRRDDIVQDALMRVLRSDADKGLPLPGSSYLWKVAYTATVDEIRRHKRRREEPLETDLGLNPQVSRTEAEFQSDPEMKRALLRGLANLSASRRMAVLLQLYGFTVEESAKILGWPAKRVDNQRFLGMSDLRQALKEQGFER